MGLDLNNLADNTARVEFEIMGETGFVVYRPMLVTEERIRAIEVKAKADESPFAEFFTEVLADWDVMYGSKKVPINVKGISGLPLPLLRAIYVAILRDTGTGGQGNSSSGISRPQDRKAKARSGTASSRRRSTSA